MNAIYWTDQARDQLADIYVRIPAEWRDDLEHAVLDIELHLQEEGLDAGESRSEPHRVYIHPVLVVFFTAIPNQLIEIYRVRSTRWREGG